MELPLLEGGMQMLGPLRGVQAGDWRACESTKAIIAFVNNRVGLLSFCKHHIISVMHLAQQQT